MSIATLKKKTQAKYNNMSVGVENFSLNGTRRSQGWVGQTMLSRSLPRTPMKGNTPKGHGGCCGTYNRSAGIIQSGVYYLNDPTVIKETTLTTMGMLEEKINPSKHFNKFTTVKPDATQNSNTMDEYTQNLARVNINHNNCNQSNNTDYSTCAVYDPYFGQKICSFTSPPSTYKTAPASEAITNKVGLELINACSNSVHIYKATNGGVLPGPAASY